MGETYESMRAKFGWGSQPFPKPSCPDCAKKDEQLQRLSRRYVEKIFAAGNQIGRINGELEMRKREARYHAEERYKVIKSLVEKKEGLTMDGIPNGAKLIEVMITRRYRVEGEQMIPTAEEKTTTYEKQPEQPQNYNDKSEDMSEAGRKAISAAQKRRWAKYHAEKREMIIRKEHTRAQHIRASPVKQIDWKAILGVSLKDFVMDRYAKQWEFNEIIEDARTKIVRAGTLKETANDLMARFTISARVEYSNALKNPKPQTLHQKAAIEYWNSPASVEHRKKLQHKWTKDSPRARRTKFYQILGKTITQFADEGIEAQTPYPTLLENGKQLIMKHTPDTNEYKRLADAFSSSLRHAYGIMTWKRMQEATA